MSRDTLFFLLLLPVVLGILWARMPDIQLLCSQYNISTALFFIIIIVTYWTLRWRTIGRASIQRVFNLDPAYEREHIKSLQYQIDSGQRRYADLKLEFDKLYAAHSLLKADNEDARQEKNALLKKHLTARSLTNNLMSQLYSTTTVLSAERSDFSKQRMRLRLMLGLILCFFQYSCLAGKRIRFLSAGTVAQKRRFSTLLFSHVALRARYVNVMNICVEARHSMNKVKQSWQREACERKCLQEDYERISVDLQTAKKDCRFYQALAWTVVARFDSLQTDYGQLLANSERLKSDYSGFRKDLREVVSIVQATQDVAQVGLNDLHRAATLRPLKVKQDLMKIGQGLDLVRLNITEMLVDLGLAVNREMGKTFVVSASSTPYVPGSVEDAVRKLKAMYEASQEHGGDIKSDDAELSDEDELQDATLASISNIEQYDAPAVQAMASLKDIISRIEGGDVRETLLKDLTSASDIVDKIQQLVDESRDTSETRSSAQTTHEAEMKPSALAERYPKIISLPN